MSLAVLLGDEKDTIDKLSIEAVIRQSFANFDENKIEQPELYDFLKTIKYK